MAIFEKTKKMDSLLQRFLEKEEAFIGTALFSYVHDIFFLRYHHYSILGVPESGVDPSFNPAEKVFDSSRFHVIDAFREVAVEKGETVSVSLQIKKGCNIGKRVILFSCRPNAYLFRQAVSAVRKAGATHIMGLFLTE